MKLVGEGLWAELRVLGRRKGKKLAAVAYVSSDEYVQFGRGDTLVVDASDAAITAGQTSVPVLRAAHKRGAKLFSFPGLHAKVYAFDRVVVVGSANLSANSASELFEAAIITEGARAVAGVQYLIEALRETAEPIDEAFLRRAAKLPVRKARKGHGTKRGGMPWSRDARIWLIGVTQLDQDAFPQEDARVKKGMAKVLEGGDLDEDDVSWVRFIGNSRFTSEAKPGDSVIQLWRAKHDARQAWVYRPVPILRRQSEPTCVRFYLHEFADSDDTVLPLTTFRKLWRAASVGAKLPKYPARELPGHKADRLLALWEGE